MKGKEDPRFITIFILTVVAHVIMKKNINLLKMCKVDREDLLEDRIIYLQKDLCKVKRIVVFCQNSNLPNPLVFQLLTSVCID